MCLCWTNIRLHAATLCPDRSLPPSALYPSGSRSITAIPPQSPTCIPQLFACPIPSVTAIFTHARTLHTHYTHTNGAAAVSFSHSCSNLLPHYALQTAPFVAATLTHLSRHHSRTTHASQPHSPGHHTRPILSRALPCTPTHPPPTQDQPDIGKIGLSKCLKEMAAYDKCMASKLKGKELLSYRAAEVYHTEGKFKDVKE